MSFKEDGVDTLGEVGLGGPGRVYPFWEIQVGQLGPYLAVVKFFMGFRDWSCGLGWQVVVPCEDMIQRRSALLALPSVFLARCVPVVHRSVHLCFEGSVPTCYPPFLYLY